MNIVNNIVSRGIRFTVKSVKFVHVSFHLFILSQAITGTIDIYGSCTNGPTFSLSRESLHVKNHTHTQIVSSQILEVPEKKKFKIAILKAPQTYRVFQKLTKLLLQRMDVTRLVVTWVGWPNTENIASLCMQILILIRERTSSQVNPSAGKACPNGLLPHTILRAM